METTTRADLFTRIGKIDLLKSPRPLTKIGKKDVKVGVASETLQRIWSLSAEMAEKIKARKKEFDAVTTEHTALHNNKKNTKSDCEEYASKHSEATKEIGALNAEATLLNEIFWRIVRFEFPELQEKATIGVRENFNLVWVDKSPLDNLIDALNQQAMMEGLDLEGLLSALFGSGGRY